jgi:hypothetical protein
MEELVSAILRLASDPEFSAQLGAAGQARALDKFSSTKLGLQLKAFLSPLAQKPLTE